MGAAKGRTRPRRGALVRSRSALLEWQHSDWSVSAQPWSWPGWDARRRAAVALGELEALAAAS